MPLSINAIASKGIRLHVAVNFGYGWREYNSQRQELRLETPKDFDFIAEDFWELEGKIVAVVGPVVQPGHFLDAFQLCALPVPYVDVDFEHHPGNYHLLVSPLRGRFTGTARPPHYDSVVGSGYPEFRGYAGSISTKE